MATELRFTSIADMLNKHAQNQPNKQCLYYPDQSQLHTYATLTFKQFNEYTDHLAEKFSDIVGQNQTNETPVVCLLANSNANYLLTIYALFKLNVTVFPLSIRNSNAAIKHLLEKSNASYLFYSGEFSSTATSFGSSVTLYQMEEMNFNQPLTHRQSTFRSTTDTNELDRICIIFHR
jgi:acyl-CoA synthetase (AMP-forming)/AMP-acid ligase II